MRTAAPRSVARELGLWFLAFVVSGTFGAVLAACYLVGVS